MQPVYQRNKVLQNIEVAPGIYRLSLEGLFSGKPGQFYMLRAWDIHPLLSRPLSIHDMDGEKIDFLYEAKGRGTRLLAGLRPGDILEMLGPLGNGFDAGSIGGKVALVSGGIGIAPLLYAAKSITGASIDLYAGFRDRAYILDRFERFVSRIYVATDSGIDGVKGFVTDLFNPKGYSAVLCCGPEIMMEKVAKKCMEENVPVYLSMERHMACGVGACLVCTCPTKDGNKRVCRDGPVFSGREVIFNA